VRKSIVRTGMAAAMVPLFTGCCSMLANLGGLGFHNHYMEPYGGVKICLESGILSSQAVVAPDEENRGQALFVATYLLALDLPLCAVADTVTLPWTIAAVLNGQARTGPIQPGRMWMELIPLANDPAAGNGKDAEPCGPHE
jgi:uncharacterized protein YceK